MEENADKEEEEDKERQNDINLKQIRSSSHEALDTSPKLHQTAQFLGDHLNQRKSDLDLKTRNAMAQSADITNSISKKPRASTRIITDSMRK